MSDDLDRAVEARITAFRPDALPPFAAIEARKRGRDRRRMAVGAGALSVTALAAVGVVVPALDRDGDRLAPGQLAGGVTSKAFDVRFAQGEGRTVDGGRDLARCAALPGAAGAVSLGSKPGSYVLAVEGAAREVSAVENCLTALPGAIVTTTDAAEPTAAQSTFYVRYDGTADTAAYSAGVAECRALPGVSGNATGESFPGDFKLAARGDDADALGGCLDATPGANVDRLDGSPSDGPGLDAYIARCVGAAENAEPAPEYLGLLEIEATRTKQAESAITVNSVRVIGRDGDCLGRTRDLRSDRVNLLIADGRVVWAGRF